MTDTTETRETEATTITEMITIEMITTETATINRNAKDAIILTILEIIVRLRVKLAMYAISPIISVVYVAPAI